MSKKGRYWMFAFDECYPIGGIKDFRFSFNNIEDFEDLIIKFMNFDSYQVLDTNTHFHFEGDLGTVTKWICKNIGDEVYEETNY